MNRHPVTRCITGWKEWVGVRERREPSLQASGCRSQRNCLLLPFETCTAVKTAKMKVEFPVQDKHIHFHVLLHISEIWCFLLNKLETYCEGKCNVSDDFPASHSLSGENKGWLFIFIPSSLFFLRYVRRCVSSETTDLTAAGCELMEGMFSRETKEGKSEKWHQNGKTLLYLAANTKWTQVYEWTNMSAILLDIISVSFQLRITVCAFKHQRTSCKACWNYVTKVTSLL